MPERRQKVKEMLNKLDKYRTLARMVADGETRHRILKLTLELEQQALEIEKTIDDD